MWQANRPYKEIAVNEHQDFGVTRIEFNRIPRYAAIWTNSGKVVQPAFRAKLQSHFC